MADTQMTISEFRIGRVLARGFSILFRNIVPFGLISLLAVSLPFLYVQAVDPWIFFR